MTDEKKNITKQLIAYANPAALLAGLLLYALGGGIARYLGVQIDWLVYWIGQGCITLFQLSSFFLKAYFDFPEDIRRRHRSKHLPRNEENQHILLKTAALQISVTTMAIGAVLTVLLLTIGVINLVTILLLGAAFMIAYFYAVPPLQLVYSGYGELAGAIFLANLTPALAYLLQTGELHRLLAMLTFPLTGLLLGSTLALLMEPYAENIRKNRRTMLVRLGWRLGFQMHHFMILVAYLLLGVAALLGLPWNLCWPAFLTLPIAAHQIWIIHQISLGMAPNWKLINFSAMITFGLTAYLIAFTLWTG